MVILSFLVGAHLIGEHILRCANNCSSMVFFFERKYQKGEISSTEMWPNFCKHFSMRIGSYVHLA